MVLPSAKITSDHIPCKIVIGTSILKSNIFRFENFWPEYPGFFEAVQDGWSKQVRNLRDSASSLAGKLKNTRYNLKRWIKNLSSLSSLIATCNKVIFYLDSLEDCRPLFLPEWNLRLIIKKHLQTLLRYKNIYWRKRYTNNRVRFGDECRKFFHAMATTSYRKNTITQLKDEQGNMVSDHESKAALLLLAYKNRMGITLQPSMLFDLPSLISLSVEWDSLIAPFTKDEIDKVIKQLPTDKAPGPDGFD